MAEGTDIQAGQWKGKSVSTDRQGDPSWFCKLGWGPSTPWWPSGVLTSGPDAYCVPCWVLASNPADPLPFSPSVLLWPGTCLWTSCIPWVQRAELAPEPSGPKTCFNFTNGKCSGFLGGKEGIVIQRTQSIPLVNCDHNNFLLGCVNEPWERGSAI